MVALVIVGCGIGLVCGLVASMITVKIVERRHAQEQQIIDLYRNIEGAEQRCIAVIRETERALEERIAQMQQESAV